LRAREFIAEQIDGSKPGRGYEVTVMYEPATAFEPGDVQDPTDPGFTEINVRYVPTIRDVWRVSSTGDNTGWTQAPVGFGTVSDIGGEAIDSAGEPTSIVMGLMELVVSHTIDGYPPYANLMSYSGARNNIAYLGAPSGSLLLKGISTTRQAVYVYKIDYTFAYDSWRHLVQVPKRDAQTGIIPTNTDGNANIVMWKQPFPWVENFEDLAIPF
jgi:hypothetical protein